MAAFALIFAASVNVFSTFVTTQDVSDLSFTISENAGINNFIGDVPNQINISSKVPAQHVDSLKYQILDQENPLTRQFTIHAQTGILRTNTSIDRESFLNCVRSETCILHIRIAIISENTAFNYFLVINCHITVVDLNDNSPAFPQPVVTHSLLEDTAVGRRIALDSAVDNDSPQYGISHYSLLSTNVPEFRLVQVNGTAGSISVYLEVVSPLDRESKPSFQLVVAAYDKGTKTGTLTVNIVIVDVNDNQPQFSSPTYSARIREDMQINESIMRIAAMDRDTGRNSELIYGFDARTQSTSGTLFHINNSTGELRLIGQLDYETTRQFILVVTAKERYYETLPVQAEVIIEVVDVNDNPPIITINAVTQSGNMEIYENSLVGTFLALISTRDPDTGEGGKYNCNLENNFDDMFALDPTSPARTDFKLKTNSNFDREVQDHYNLPFVCTDRGNPSLRSTSNIRVTILDENDNAPLFTQAVYNVTVDENNPFGMFLIQVHASDDDFGQNGQVIYELYNEAAAYIQVDPTNGNVSARVSFDYERYQVLSFGIMAKDRGTQSHTTTAILNIFIRNLNDEPPAFEQAVYDFSVAENNGIMIPIGQVNVRERAPGSASVHFHMDDSSEYRDLFEIAASNGTVFASTSFDADIAPSNVYQFNVHLIDSSNSNLRTQALVKITITDLNDNPPHIHYPGPYNHSVQIGSDFPTGNIVVTVIASDKDYNSNDNARLRFMLQSGDGSHYFYCDEESGEIRTTGSLNGQESHEFRLAITVLDSGYPPLADNATLFVFINQSLNTVTTDDSKSNENGRLVENDNITIAICVAVVSGILIVFLVIAIVILMRKDRIILYQKQKRLAKLFSTQKQQVEAKKNASAKGRGFDSLDGVNHGFSNEVSTSDEYLEKGLQKSAEKAQNVAPWLSSQGDMADGANLSVVSDQSLGSDSGRGSHEDPDLTARHFQDGMQHLPSPAPIIPPRGRNTESNRNQRHTSPPTVHFQDHNAPHNGEVSDNSRRVGRPTVQSPGDNQDAYVQLARTTTPIKLYTQIQPDHKLLYKRSAPSPSHHNISTQSSGYSSHSSTTQNYQLQLPNPPTREGDPFSPSASYI